MNRFGRDIVKLGKNRRSNFVIILHSFLRNTNDNKVKYILKFQIYSKSIDPILIS